MLHRIRTWAHFALIFVVLFSLSVVFAQDSKPEAVGLRPDAPTYALHGPYWVGTREFTIPDKAGKHPLDITVWYPARNPKGLDETTSYFLVPKVEMGLPADWRAQLAGHALRDAAPDLTRAAYPLVIFSHGFGGNRQSSAFLTEHLASYGFVVIAPDHIEMWDPTLSKIANSYIERPLDVQQVIVYAETLTQSGGDLAGLFDVNQMAVAGWSNGGYTALMLGGARFDAGALNERCKTVPPDAPFANICNATVTNEAEMAKLAGLNSVPDGFWPSWNDSRVKAVISLASPPVIQEKGLSQIKVPVLALVGTADSGGWGFRSGQEIFESVSSSQKALVTLANADHYIFNWQAKDCPDLVKLGFFGVGSDLVWEMDRAHDLINHFTTAFLLDVLKGDKEASKTLVPDAVSFPGIEYKAQGF